MENNKNVGFIEKSLSLPKAKEMSSSLIKEVKEGNMSALKASIVLKKFEKAREHFEKNPEIKSQLEDEIRKYQEGKTSKVFGASVTEQARGYYDFSTCNDPYWEELSAIQEKVSNLLKDREEYLKSLHPDNKKENLKAGKIDFKVQTEKAVIDKTYKFIEEPVETEVFEINTPRKGYKTVFAYRV